MDSITDKKASKLHEISSQDVRILGLMSGTSLDGLDLCLAHFWKDSNAWQFAVEAAETRPYDAFWRQQLRQAHELDTLPFLLLNKSYGKYLGEQCKDFLQRKNLKAGYIASHGHTIFHQPGKGLTVQIGCGNTLAAAAGISTIFDFRSLNVAHGGQGAPLVPIGDKLLFSGYSSCLNLGGFANISFEQNGQRIAYDACPCNIVLNKFAQELGAEYDKNGEFASSGVVCQPLLDELNNLDFYGQQGAKSLGREWVENVFSKVFEKYKLDTKDKLRTTCEHVAMQVARCQVKGSVLVTGGGAFNSFLMQRISALAHGEVAIPCSEIVNFKEALIFAFLGTLYLNDEPNCWPSATGARAPVIGGTLVKVLPKSLIDHVSSNG
ncbi:MAG: anhydro-N-acetylmuramic acid kinase [Prevotellaceae bacterium]|jgi:anhydro-N-acetylmuramic acid kinase|nr:anhydro-N-acetylmuramic acid kinase [Prevotellaceae bacterium]